MIPNVLLCLLVGVMAGTGVYLLLARSISRALIGFLLLSNGVNILFLVASGPRGGPPIMGTGDPEGMSDPLPQAMVLTAIVITLGMMAFVLAMAHRSWQLARTDVVADDTEDVRILRKAEADDLTDSDFAPGRQEEDPHDADDVVFLGPQRKLVEEPRGGAELGP